MLSNTWHSTPYRIRHTFRAHGVLLLVALLFLLALLAVSARTHAQSVDDIRNKIDDRNQKINELEEEIKMYENTLNLIGKEKRTLESTIQTLDVSRKKISTDIALTQNKIDTTNFTIGELEDEIADKEKRVGDNKRALAEAIRNLNILESDSLVETVLAHDNLSEVWNQLTTLEQFQTAVQADVKALNQLKAELLNKRAEAEGKRDELAAYKTDLSGKKRVLDQNRNEKDYLLKVTQNKESNYQQLLDEKRAAYEQFARELQDLEAQLQYTLDPNSIPSIGQGILGWPLDTLYVTQYFGNTPFAKSGAYSGKGHNGTDFRASIGTAVHAALSGTVVGTGNTDSVPGCYSYGKWVLVRHFNGLSTLYAHLSVINVSANEPVSTGEVIGYSGNTGYSTGPHLHFSVYAADAVKVVRLGDIKKLTNCGNAYIPVAPLEAYLNPLDYLKNSDSLR